MGGLWKGEMEKRETERKERERGSCVCGGGGISHYQKERKRQRMLSKKDRKIKSRKIKRAGTKYTQMGN